MAIYNNKNNNLHQNLRNGDPLLPPPMQQQKNLPPPPPKHVSSRAANGTSNGTAANTTYLVLDDDSDDLTAEEATDDEGPTAAARRAAVSSSAELHSIEVEDVCLVCRGSCRCGGATGAAVYIDSPNSRPRAAAPAGVSHASSSASSSNTSTPHAHAIMSSSFLSGEPQAGLVASAVRNRRESDFAPDEVSRPIKKQKIASSSRKNKKIATSSKPKASTPKGTSHKKRDSAAPSISRGVTVPSRMSLRQVLAMSVREASLSANNSEADTDADTPAFDVSKEQRPKEDLSDISDLELLGDGDSDDEEIEKAEEDALRKEFEREQRGTDNGDDSLTEMDDDDETNDEDEEMWVREKAEPAHAEADNIVKEKSVDVVSAGDLSTELPPDGGLGVVTWSDYDSVDVSDDEVEERNHSQLADFEQELEELLALSEAVVGPVRDDEVDLGQLWFEEITDNDGDDESGSAADDESEGDDGGDDTDDEREDADQTVLVVDGGWNHQTRSLSGSSAGDSASEEIYYEDGDTTDTIDSDELVRFGIEVDDESDSGLSDNLDYYTGMPGTASLADVQAPTSADLATLPGYMLNMNTASERLTDFDADPQHQVMATEDLGVVVSREESRKRSAASSPKKNKKRKMVDIMEEDETATSNGTDGESSKTPAMGVFSKKDRAPELAIVVIDGTTFAPSPFSKTKKGKRTSSHHFLDDTPSRRERADSKVSTTSVTDGSISGDIFDLPSPVLANVDIHFGIDDVLHESMLDGESTPSSSDDESGVGQTLQSASKSSALSDFSRWNRIPIGAFRSSTMPGGQQSHQPQQDQQAFATQNAPTPRNGFSPAVSSSIVRGPRAVTSLNNTLSSPGVHQSNRRAIEKRMLTSPVFGPASGVAIGGSATRSSSSSRPEVTVSGTGRKSKKKGKTPAASRSGSPQGPMVSLPASFSNSNSSTLLRIPHISPFVPTVGLPSEPSF